CATFTAKSGRCYILGLKMSKEPKISFVIPVYNESAGLDDFHSSLVNCLDKSGLDDREIIYVNDGSTDGSLKKLNVVAKNDKSVRVLALSRNFGKEIATTAGIQAAHGAAVITIDGDGQHPVELIPEFIGRWQAGAKVVIGLRISNHKEGLVKRFGSKLFYGLFNRFTGAKLIPGSTDFRLIDRTVQAEFNRMSEHNRITRGLIDWLGFEREYIKFKAKPRQSGDAGYSFKKLFKLAIDSTISLSLSPLYIAAIFGAVVLPLSMLLGLFMLTDAALSDPLNLNATGSAYVIVLILFLIGVLLVSQGIIGLYLSHIHTETQNRPLYIVDKASSVNIDEN
ncbi:MAG TPA: glycosyltransferase family 2 protein, partial [Candidatus Binatia bacterium]|nr:glycosyltransferase family 2 protein [Candidatus Binatia bacterium]